MTDLPRRLAGPTTQDALQLRASLVSRRQLFGMGGALAAGLGLAACGTSGSSSPTGGAGKSGGTLTMGINAPPDTLDPGATGLALTLMLSMAMFDPLVWWLPDASGSGTEYVPGLADSYTVNADASVFTFKLKQGVTFH